MRENNPQRKHRIRKDKRALKIVFPAGTVATFAPLDETEETEETNSHSLKKEDGE